MPITYPTLYHRDSKGKIRVWHMEQDDDKYRTVNGLQDGQLVYSDWTLVEPKNTGKKNATTATEQTTKEINAKYTKQLKTNYHENINDIDTVKYIEPMLAHKYSKHHKKVDPSTGHWVVQCKYNGFRCVITKDSMKSRENEPYISVPHIARALEEFFTVYPNAVLDGELFNYDYRQQLNMISSICRKTKNITAEDLELSEKIIKFYIYDGYGFGNDQMMQETPYRVRKAWIDQNVIGIYRFTEYVRSHDVTTMEEVNALYEEFVADGQEGIMLRNINTPYVHNRSVNLLKMKPEDDDEFEILDILPGKGNWSGKAKIISVKMPNGKIFDAVFKGTMEEAIECLENKHHWIGKTVTIKYNGLTGLMTPNFAQFDYRNCLNH
jgi:ATP-dependent DNA ligase